MSNARDVSVGEETYVLSPDGDDIRVGVRAGGGDVRWLPERLPANTPIDDEDALRPMLIAMHERGG